MIGKIMLCSSAMVLQVRSFYPPEPHLRKHKAFPGNRIERCLSYDEKPLLLFQKLKDAKKNPVFMLKHIRDIRSPIAVAQQKQAARTKEKEKLASTAAALSKNSAGATSKSGKFPDVTSPTVSSAVDGNVKERESMGPAESGSGSAGGSANTNGDAAHS